MVTDGVEPGIFWLLILYADRGCVGLELTCSSKFLNTYFFIIKRTRCTKSPNLLRHETLRVSGSSYAHHQEFIHCMLGTGLCHTGLKTAFEQDQKVPSSSKAVFKHVWQIPVPSVQWINSWWWAYELTETRRVSCRSKSGKLVHLFGFIIKKFVTMRGHMNGKVLFPFLKWHTVSTFSAASFWLESIKFR
jgi:hypothetical protein